MLFGIPEMSKPTIIVWLFVNGLLTKSETTTTRHHEKITTCRLTIMLQCSICSTPTPAADCILLSSPARGRSLPLNRLNALWGVFSWWVRPTPHHAQNNTSNRLVRRNIHSIHSNFAYYPHCSVLLFILDKIIQKYYGYYGYYGFAVCRHPSNYYI